MRFGRQSLPKTQALRQNLCSTGFTHIFERDLLPTGRSLSSLQPVFDSLPQDQYYTDGRRYRALSKFDVLVTDDEFILSNEVVGEPYFQSTAYNPSIGGIKRRYSPLSSYCEDMHLLLDFVTRHLQILPDTRAGASYRLNLHAIRMLATATQPCDTSPPGLHKDGEKYIAVYLVRRENAKGAENVIVYNARNHLDRFELTSCGDGYLIDDDAVWHSLTPLTIAGPATQAIRDILLIDFLPCALDVPSMFSGSDR